MRNLKSKTQKPAVRKRPAANMNPYKAALSGFNDKESKVNEYPSFTKGEYLVRVDYVELKFTESKGKTVYSIEATTALPITDANGDDYNPEKPKQFKGNQAGEQASIGFVKGDIPAFFFRDIRKFLSAAFNCDVNEDVTDEEVYMSCGIDTETYEPTDIQPCAGILIELTVGERAKKNPTDEEKASGVIPTFPTYEFGATYTTEEAEDVLGDSFKDFFPEGKVVYISSDEEGENEE